MKRILTLTVLSISLGSFACSHDEKPAESASTPVGVSTASSTTLDTAPADPQMQTASDPSANTMPATPPAPAFTDTQIAAITNVANSGEVDQAKLALTKAQDPKVKQFAQMMVNHHGAAKTEQDALMTKLKMTPESNATSVALAKDGTDAIVDLKTKSGAEFDRAYIDLQVKEHRDVLTLIDEKLLPAVSNPDFKKALTDVRVKVAQHFIEAQALQNQMKAK